MNRTRDGAAAKQNLEHARACLTLIRDIAERGASSAAPENVGYALQEVTQVLLERTGTEERIFEPVPADEIGSLKALQVELEFVNCSSQDLATAERAAMELHSNSVPFAGQEKTKQAGTVVSGVARRRTDDSARDRIDPLFALGFGGGDNKAQLLRDGPGQEAPNRMRLPAGNFDQFLGGCALRTLEQIENLRRLATVTGGAGLLGAFGRIFRRDGLDTRLALLRPHVRATCATAGRFGSRWFHGRRREGGLGCFCHRNHTVSPWAVITAMTLITAMRKESKRNLNHVRGDGMAMKGYLA